MPQTSKHLSQRDRNGTDHNRGMPRLLEYGIFQNRKVIFDSCEANRFYDFTRFKLCEFPALDLQTARSIFQEKSLTQSLKRDDATHVHTLIHGSVSAILRDAIER